MIGSIKAIYLDVNDIDRAARFWSLLLGLDPRSKRSDRDGGVFRNLCDASGNTQIVLQKTTERHTVKNRLHLDVQVESVATAVKRIEEIGGTVVGDMTPPNRRFMVMADPDGNEFCVVT